MREGAALLQDLTDRQKANLSYWIYKHNLEHRLFDLSTLWDENLLVLDQAWVEGHRDRTPSASDRMLMFLREMIRSDDADEQPREELLLAAGGCRHDGDLKSLRLYAMERGWLGGGGTPESPSFPHPGLIDLGLGARIHVEEELREHGQGSQGFVAMWFDDSTNAAYEGGIKPALESAGYEALRIDHKEFLGKVDDEIVAEIRKSKFVVADFTTSKKSGARGGVYYEAGFAHGLGIPVIHTCRKDRMKDVHFDTNHINHLTWETPEDLRTNLQLRIERVLGRGPL